MRVRGYTDLAEIGVGGSAIVYRASQVAVHRTVALKVLRATLTEAERKRFERECEAIAAIGWHPRVLAIHDAGVTEEGHPYMAFEYLPRGSLATRLERSGPLTPREVAAIAIQVADALDAAHRQGIVHRDVKPANLLTSQVGDVKLADFGIAVLGTTNTSITTSVTGTLAFMAPELFDGERATPSSDLYALGATMFGLLRGEAAFNAHTPIAVIGQVASAPVPDLRSDGVPAGLADLIEWSMAKSAANRPGSAAELIQALGAVSDAHGWPRENTYTDRGHAAHDADVPVEPAVEAVQDLPTVGLSALGRGPSDETVVAPPRQNPNRVENEDDNLGIAGPTVVRLKPPPSSWGDTAGAAATPEQPARANTPEDLSGVSPPALSVEQDAPSSRRPYAEASSVADVRAAGHSTGGGSAGRRRRRWVLVAAALVVMAAIVGGLLAQMQRPTYFVGFDEDQVALFKGAPGGFLWTDPELRETTDLQRSELPADVRAAVAANKEFSSEAAATRYIVTLQAVVDDEAYATEARLTTTTSAPTRTTTTLLTGEATVMVVDAAGNGQALRLYERLLEGGYGLQTQGDEDPPNQAPPQEASVLYYQPGFRAEAERISSAYLRSKAELIPLPASVPGIDAVMLMPGDVQVDVVVVVGQSVGSQLKLNRPGFDGGSGYLVSTSSPVPVS